MAFNITLYCNKSPSNAVNKTLEEVSRVSGTLRGACPVESPTIVVRGDSEKLLKADYLFFEPWKRWYYISSRTSLTSKLMEYSCTVDVLMTYRKEILANEALVGRSETDYDLYIADPQVVTHAKPLVQVYQAVPDDEDMTFSLGHYILDVFGPNAEAETQVDVQSQEVET